MKRVKVINQKNRNKNSHTHLNQQPPSPGRNQATKLNVQQELPALYLHPQNKSKVYENNRTGGMQPFEKPKTEAKLAFERRQAARDLKESARLEKFFERAEMQRLLDAKEREKKAEELAQREKEFRPLRKRDRYLLDQLTNRYRALKTWLQVKPPIINKVIKKLKNRKLLAQEKSTRSKVIVTWLRRLRLRRLLRARHGRFPFRHKKTDLHYLVRLPSAITYKFGAMPHYPKFRYSTQSILHRVRPVWQPFKSTPQALWNFFENYRKYQCRWLAARWREQQLKKLSRWVRANMRFGGISKFFILDTIYNVLNRVSNKQHSEEIRTRRAQRAFTKWAKRKHLPFNKNFRWLHRELDGVVASTAVVLKVTRPKCRSLTSWGVIKRLLRVIAKRRKQKLGRRPLLPARLSRRNKSALARKRYFRKMAVFNRRVRSRSKARRLNRLNKKISPLLRILWRFMSPEIRCKAGAFPRPTKKGLKPTDKKLLPYLKRVNWANFTTRPLRRDYLEQYRYQKRALEKEYKETVTRQVKRVWAEYREKISSNRRTHWYRKWRWRARSRHPKQPLRASIKATYVALLPKIYRTTLPNAKFSFGASRQFSTFHKSQKRVSDNKGAHPENKNSAVNKSRRRENKQRAVLTKTVPTTLKLTKKVGKKLSRAALAQKKSASVGIVARLIKKRLGRKVKSLASRVARYWRNRNQEALARLRGRRRKKKVHLAHGVRKGRSRSKLRLFLARKARIIRRRRKAISFRLQRKTTFRRDALQKTRQLRKKVTARTRKHRALKISRRGVIARRSKVSTLFKKQSSSIRKAGNHLLQTKKQSKVLSARNKRLFLSAPRLRRLQLELRSKRANSVSTVQKKGKFWTYAFTTTERKKRRRFKKWKYDGRRAPFFLRSPIRKRKARTLSNWQKQKMLLAKNLLLGSRRFARRMKLLTRWFRRIRARIQRKRLRGFSKQTLRVTPALLPSLKAAGPYERGVKGVWLNKRKIKKLSRPHLAPQLNLNGNKENKKLAQKFLTLQLANQSPKRVIRLGARATANMLQRVFAVLPTPYSRRGWPFRPLQNKKISSKNPKYKVRKGVLPHTGRFSTILRSKVHAEQSLHRPAAARKAELLTRLIRGIDYLSDFDERKQALTLDVTRTPVVRSYNKDTLAALRLTFSAKRKKILVGLKKRVKWTTTNERGQHRAYKKALKKRLRPRGRFWWKGFKRKPTKRKRNHLLAVARRASIKKVARRLSNLKLTQLRLKRARVKSLKKQRTVRRKSRRLRLRRKKINKKRFSRKHLVFARRLLHLFSRNSRTQGISITSTSKKTRTLAQLWQKFKRADIQKRLLRLPYSVPQYRLRSRLLAKAGSRHLSREQQVNQKNKNKDRHIAALHLYDARNKSAMKWNKLSPFFKWGNSLQYEEKFKQNIHRKNWSPARDSSVEARAGYPAVLGVRRYRRVFVAKFNKNRWWRPTALPLPHEHPLSLQQAFSANSVPSQPPQLFQTGRVKVATAKSLATRESQKNFKKRKNNLRLSTKSILTGNKGKEKSLAPWSRRSLFFTEAPFWKNNTNWALLERGLVNEHLGLSSALKNAASKKANALMAALQLDAPAWAEYSKTYSTKTATALQSYFIKTSTRWLRARPIEKLVSTWDAATWLKFRQFSEFQKTTGFSKRKSVAAFRRDFITASRHELLTHSPNWWEQEAKLRASAFLQAVTTRQQPKIILQQLNAHSSAAALFGVQAGAGWQEKKLLAFSALHLAGDEKSDYLSELEKSAFSSNSLDDKAFSPLYYKWLLSLETHLKKARKALSSQDYNELRGSAVTEAGTEHPRFPGTGRQRKTFDALLRRHYSRVMPLRRRRLARRGLRKLRFSSSASFIFRAPRFESSAKQRRGQKISKNFQLTPYLTSRQRELTNRAHLQRKKAILPTEANKTRFTSLPLHLITGLRSSKARQHRAIEITSFSGLTEGLLQTALRKRFVARRIRDLRKSSTRRKFSRNRSVPFWIQRKLDRKTDRAARIARYNLNKFSGRAGATTKNWIFSEFALRVPKNRARIATQLAEILVHKSVIKRRRKITLRRWKRLGVQTFKARRATYRIKGRAKLNRRYKFKLRRNRYQGYRRPMKRATLKAETRLLRRFEKAQLSANYKCISYSRPSMVLSPLHFHRPTTRVSVTAEDKERWRLHTQATRLRKYRRLTELSESLTSFFPQLISWLLTKKMKERNVTPAVAAKWVYGIYWSLRMYLNYDFKHVRFDTRDSSLPRLQLLKKEITSLSDNRYFDLSSLRGARFRFQPHTLHRAGSLRRGALAWLRQFLPNFYELYLEDPEKYKHLTLTPIKVFRSHLASRATSDWETRNVPGTMEQRYNRLTTTRYGKNSTRFENMLMTTRRTPVLGGYGAAAALQVISPVGSSTVRNSFFHRRFSAQARPQVLDTHFQTMKLITARAHLLRRQTTTETQATSQQTSLATRLKIKSTTIAKARAHSMFSGRDGASGSLDLRLIRGKSPRNADYLRRLPLLKSSDLPLTVVPYHDALAVLRPSKKTPRLAVFRDSRVTSVRDKREVAITALLKQSPELKKNRKKPTVRRLPLLTNSDFNSEAVFRDSRAVRAVSILNNSEETLTAPLNQSPALQKYRKEISVRRSPALLKSRYESSVESSKMKLIAAGRLYTKKNVKKRGLIDELLPQKKKGPKSTIEKIKSVRSVLSSRKAPSRSLKHTYKSRPAILTHAIQLRRRPWNSLRLNNYAAVLSAKYKKQVPRHQLYRYFKAESLRPVFTKKIKAATRKVVTGRDVGAVKRLIVTPQRKSLFSLSLTRKKVTAKRPTRTRAVNSNFIHHAKAIHSNLALLSRYTNRVEKERARAMFSERRPELWNMLTLRWNKKFRYLKKWLRDIKYAFKQHYWSYEGEHVLPDELFKLARIRLRKLDWRESDELFFRDGLRHAFTFHPRERSSTRWLEPLLLRRSLYNQRRGEYRRYQFPREQKNRKWLQKLRKLMFRNPPSRMYIKGRRWPLLRMYSQRLHRSAFHIRNSKAALKRFRKATRRKAAQTGFEKLMVGFGDRLDVNLMLLNIAPTTFWAREMSPMGLLSVNGKVIRDAAFRFRPGDFVEWAWEKIKQVRIHFKSPFKRFNRTTLLQDTSLQFPGNFEYSPKLRAAHYLRLPRPEDLAEAGRVNECLFRWFRLDGGLGRK